MAYIPIEFKDREVEFPNRYKDQNNNQYTFTRDEGEIIEPGTLNNASVMNHIEAGITTVETSVSGLQSTIGNSTDTFSTDLTYAVNTFTIYQNKIWKCTTAVTVAGAWTGAANWVESSILEGNQINNKLIKNQTVLWTNPSPGSLFSPQTISIDLTDYNRFIVVCLTGDTYSTQTILKGFTIRMTTTGFSVSDNTFVRNVTASDAGMTFGNCSGYGVGNNTTFTSTVNTGLIPYQIIGYE